MSSLPRTAILNVVGLTPRHLGPDTPFLSRFLARDEITLSRVKPLLPAVTSTMQATFLTGKTPADHGIVGNCWYDRDYAEHRNWKQSNHLVHAPKLWDHLREQDPEFTTAKLFWWNNMYSTVDFSITPRPIYRVDGRKIFDIQTWPMDLRPPLKQDLGDFPFQAFWGPLSGIASSDWIARSARWIEEKHSPNLNLVYLPHLDYPIQKTGPGDPDLSLELQRIDLVVEDLVRFLESRGVRPIILSEYGITEVDRPIHLNRRFREKGWIVCRDEVGTDMIDLGSCRAFAVPDHQVAHVYLNDPSLRDEVRDLLSSEAGVEQIIEGEERAALGLDHDRAGDFVVVSDSKSWFTYYYWDDDRRAPDFARTIDIHRKPGYDPCELFFDPRIKAPKLKVAWKLLRKILGFRMTLDVIPLDASLVKGSHGRIPEDTDDWPLILGEIPGLAEGKELDATEVYRHLFETCARPGS